MSDVLDKDPEIDEAVPAEDPQPGSFPLDVLYLRFYNSLEPVFCGWTRDHRSSVAMRQKAADIALNLVAIATR